MILATLFEIGLASLVIWATVKEDKLIEFEEKIKARLKK